MAGKRGVWSAVRQERFLSVLRETSNVTRAAEAAEKTTGEAYRLRRRDPAFAAAWMVALDEGYGRLELLMLERGLATLEGGEGSTLNERTILTLLAQHRQGVRDYRAARGRAVAHGVVDPEDPREMLVAQLNAMHERLAGHDG